MATRLVLLCALIAACGAPAALNPTPKRGEGALASARSLEALVVRRLEGAAIARRSADPHELCRRMAIDLIGRAPTDAELTQCLGRTPLAMADAFMEMPEYLFAQRREWAKLVNYRSGNMWYAHTLELDALVARLYREEISYGELAAIFVVHPAFYSRHQGDDWVSTLFTVFLGRPARVDEIAGLRPLVKLWGQRDFCDGVPGTAESPDCARQEFGYDFCACTPADDFAGCVSTTLGRRVAIAVDGCPAPAATPTPAAPLLVRASKVGAGERTSCPRNTKAACVDTLAQSTEEEKSPPLKPLREPTPAERKLVGAIGEALVSRHDFWEAPVDRELVRLLGWWQSGFRRPDVDLPEVRALLASELRRTGSLRHVQRLIVTSLLYTAPAAPRPAKSGEAPPPWAMGPTKALLAEPWLDSLGVAVGETLGRCDFRFLDDGGPDLARVDASFVDTVTPTLDAKTFAYAEVAAQLGGCTVGARPVSSSLGLVRAQHEVAHKLCTVGRGVVPTARGGTALDVGARHLVRRVLSREASAEEVRTFTGEMKQCIGAHAANPKVGCRDDESAVRWLCVRLVESAEFGFY